MKAWNDQGMKVSICQIDNVWSGGILYLYVENKGDLRILDTIRKRLNLRHLECFKLSGNPEPGLYARGACDYFKRITPLLK